MSPKSKKNSVKATQNIDNVLFEKNGCPRLRIMVSENELEKVAKIKITYFFAATEKIFNGKK